MPLFFPLPRRCLEAFGTDRAVIIAIMALVI
jgi:hypothetical protein